MTRPRRKRNLELEWARHLAEAIILQAIEDVFCSGREEESMEFFKGEGFTDCADVIGMSLYERQKILCLLEKASNNPMQLFKPGTSSTLAKRFIFYPQHPRLQM